MTLDAFQRWDYIPETMFEVALSEDEKVEFDGILNCIRNNRDRSPLNNALSFCELLVFNRYGKQKPIFWCFNNWAEPYLIYHQLPKDRPLIAANSFNGSEQRWLKKARYTEPIAQRYLSSVKSLFKLRDFIIIGNCQGAPIAESMAIQLAENYDIYSQLITLDYIPKRQYQGPILMLFGKKSPYNPFLYDTDPLCYWRERLTSFRWAFLEATHGTYFREPTISELCTRILNHNSKMIYLQNILQRFFFTVRSNYLLSKILSQ